MFRFERLQVWHKAIDLFDWVDQVAEGLPGRVRFSVVDQWRRAALSVSSNIAEGTGRETQKESSYFFSVAKGSTYEVVSISMVCKRRNLISAEAHRDIYVRAEEIAKMLTALKRAGKSA